MIQNISNVLFSFAFFSILGWIMEVVYRSTHERHFVNPGLLKGPYLILYGTAALILMGCITLIHEWDIFIKVFCYFLITTGLELISGVIAQHFFKLRLWDYSDQRFQLKGHICLKFSIYWVILAFAFEYFLLPLYQCMTNWLPLSVEGVIGAIGVFWMVIDFALIMKKELSRYTRDRQKQSNVKNGTGIYKNSRTAA